MKEETKNEMDLLLRRLGRREETSLSNAADGHLDADELSAYAENALPGAARARYTSHLAECSRCRELVVQLSSAVGVVAATETGSVSKPPAWRMFLASLFTPMVLRYAAPALVLIVVAAIGFVVLRREQPARFVTQVANDEKRTALPEAKPFTTVSPDDGRAKTETRAGLPDKQVNTPQQPAQSAPVPNAPPAVSNVEAEVSKGAAAGQPKPEAQTAVANEPPPPKTAPTPTTEVSQKPADIEASKKEVRGLTTLSAPMAERDYRAENKREDKDNFAREPRAADQVRAASPARSAKLKRDDLSANTRSVAGRRFQKKGGVWIDTAYDSSKDITSVTRGSEQYRGLVADEPEIKTIADELDGEIIVVWKSQTYRIH